MDDKGERRTKKKTFFNSMVAAYTGWTDSRNEGAKAVSTVFCVVYILLQYVVLADVWISAFQSLMSSMLDWSMFVACVMMMLQGGDGCGRVFGFKFYARCRAPDGRPDSGLSMATR